ncbi:MAG: SDR family NAD(P)-dependent oxidoreductase [Spirochaetaceae bacterium]|nr:SDR family NAD(P)-dependent oxidoreductase [Spirochaetaceae bacterium]
MNLTTLKGRNVWITGASSGIGLELSILAARAGAHLQLFSSRKDALANAAGLCTTAGAASVGYDPIDLSVAASAKNLIEEVLGRTGAPDYLILNAGVSQRAVAGETELDVTRKIMDVNFFGSIVVARSLLPAMLEQGGGHIGVTSSLSGIFGFPLRSSYAASKHALHGYFESLALEYSGSGITVTLVAPGRINTPISLSSLKGDGRAHAKNDPGLAAGMDAGICARRYWKAVIKGRRLKLIGGKEILMVYFYRYLPGIFRMIAGKTSPV